MADTNPLLYIALTLPLGLLLVTAACGIWLSLRALAGRGVPVRGIGYMPFDEMRLRIDEILPMVTGLTVALPALQFLVPVFFTFPSADQFHVVQAPGIFSGWLVAWAVWSMPVSRGLKIYQIITPVLIILSVLMRGGNDNSAVALFVDVIGFAYFAWLCITPIWLVSLMRQPTLRAEPRIS